MFPAPLEVDRLFYPMVLRYQSRFLKVSGLSRGEEVAIQSKNWVTRLQLDLFPAPFEENRFLYKTEKGLMI